MPAPMAGEKCPLVIVIHGFTGYKEEDHIVAVSRALNGIGYATLRVEDCRRLAFSGIHVVAPSLLRLMEEWPPRFGIIDFYLSVCDRMVIRGVVQDGLRMLDVGKVDSLEKASDFEGELKRS